MLPPGVRRPVARAPAPGGAAPPEEPAAEAPRELLFVPVKIDGPVHNPAKHTYWFGPFAECSSVLDIDGDGKLDIASGRNYYVAPNWKKFADYRDGAETNGPDVNDNYEGTMDVNNDGRPDVLSSGWMRRQGIWWYENPGQTGVKWTSHALLEADGVEGMVIGNLSGGSEKDVLVNYFARKPGRGLIWFEFTFENPDQNVRFRNLLQNFAPLLGLKKIARVSIAQGQQTKHGNIVWWTGGDLNFSCAGVRITAWCASLLCQHCFKIRRRNTETCRCFIDHLSSQHRVMHARDCRRQTARCLNLCSRRS